MFLLEITKSEGHGNLKIIYSCDTDSCTINEGLSIFLVGYDLRDNFNTVPDNIYGCIFTKMQHP